MRAGFNTHLSKPIAKSTLMQAIGEYARACDRPGHQGAPPAEVATAATTATDPSVAHLAPRYLRNMRKELAALEAACAAGDFATLQRIGHNLRGTGGSFGFPRITELGTAIEQAAKQQDLPPIASATSELGVYLEEAVRSLA